MSEHTESAVNKMPEPVVKYAESSELPTQWGTFTIHAFVEEGSEKEHILLTYGDFGKHKDDVRNDEPTLIRIHSECLTGDALFSLRCDCGAQLQLAMQKIAIEGRGAIFYLRQEGRGIGLVNKVRAYKLQDSGLDTVEANEQLGFAADMRQYSMLKTMFEHIGVRSVRVMTNNPKKLEALENIGITVSERLVHDTGRNSHNIKYLDTKKGKLGHMLNAEDPESLN